MSPAHPAAPTSRRILRVVMSVAALLAGSGVTVASSSAATSHSIPPAAAPAAGSLRDVAQRMLDIGNPGYLARINDGRRVSTTAAGVADRATGRALRADDQFEIGSNTKTFTATLILQLVDRKAVRLDSPVSAYLPGVVPGGDDITVRMLLNHTSGLFSYTGDPGVLSLLQNDPQHNWTEQELLTAAFAHPPTSAPGKMWSYSNTNYTLLGMIAEKLTGSSLADLVRERIARPLGLEDTYYADPRATGTGRGYAHGYAIIFAGGTPEYTDYTGANIGGWAGAAGAVISTAGDLSRFYSALLKGELFSRTQLRQMKTTIALPPEFPIKGGYGLGLIEFDTPCGKAWGHGGDTQGHHSTTAVSGDGRRTAVSDSTGKASDLAPNDGITRWITAEFAAQKVVVCHMLGKPVPDSLIRELHGGAS
ncbi:serine hydrolase domain-containing protein [Pseudosporangium ferrugineum]|uniref:D-alanyl-D-alanine carboxypeptidase n=1 Tax=Pseudosporangium ferrugineum TaxID=439699 RepID=A0A2T0RJG3_9ACTN|nr:serine hydrolase domain-containing protein [Pseudosporangium ferrugineum]PRY21323.1 D-alanyl-D-alanine carboxypeptidase [Pseudosporangium ferrugineum]